MKVSGSKTTWRALAYIFGTMAVFTKASTKMIRSTDSEFITGLMEENMRVIGKTENSKFR